MRDTDRDASSETDPAATTSCIHNGSVQWPWLEPNPVARQVCATLLAATIAGPLLAASYPNELEGHTGTVHFGWSLSGRGMLAADTSLLESHSHIARVPCK